MPITKFRKILTIILCLLFISGILLPVISLIDSSFKLLWIMGIWFGFFFSAALLFKASSIKLISLCLAMIFLGIGIYEIYLHFDLLRSAQTPVKRDYYSEQFGYSGNPILGYAPYKGIECLHTRNLEDELIFQALYTIDSAGLRVPPPHRDDCNKDIIFFGCSYMFGTGVDDHETIPYRVGLKTDGEYRVHNFGFQGYGPHQMLSALEDGWTDSVIEGEPEYVIYQALTSHIARVAGMAVWDRQGPRYLLTGDGRVERQGSFSDITESDGILPYLGKALEHSLIYSRMRERNSGLQRLSADNTRLFIEVVAKSKKIIEKKYPGCEFHMIFWLHPDIPHMDIILDRAGELGLKIHYIGDILPQFQRKRMTDYALHKHEAHPSALAYEIIADYITDTIIGYENR